MKAASSSEWYDTTPRQYLPRLHHQHHPSTSSVSSSSTLPRLQNRHQQHRGLFPGDSSFSSSQRYASPSLAVASSGYSFSSSTGASTTNTNSTYPHHPRPQRQLSKVLTPTITSTSSTSFSKSYSRSSRSLSNSTSEPTATSEATTETTASSNNRPPYSFSSDANKFNNRTNRNRLFPESSGASYTSGSRVPSTPIHNLPPVTSETEVSETETVTEEEEEPGPTEDYYDEEDDEEDQIYQSFKQSVRMLGFQTAQNQDQRRSNPRPQSPALSLRSIVTELEDEDEEDRPLESVDDEATSYTEEDEDEEEEEEEGATTSSGVTSDTMERYFRSRSVPKTPVKVRVKVEKALPRTYFDDRVKVTVQVEEEEEETEVSEGDESDNEEEEDEESATESENTSTNTAETVRYLRADETRTGESIGESSGDESGQSESEMVSEESEEEEEMITSTDKTDYSFGERGSLFPPIKGVHPYNRPYSRQPMSPGMDSWLGRTPAAFTSGRTFSIPDELQEMSGGGSSSSGETLKKSGASMESGSGSTNSEETTNTASSGSTAVTASNSDLSSRSQSARSSLIGRASAIHKMYSVGGKVRSLSARKSPALHRHLPSPLASPRSTDSGSPSVSSSSNNKTGSGSETSGSKQFLPEAHLGTLAPPNILSHSRSLSATSSRHQFSAALRQLSLGNIQAMNPPVPKSAAHVLAEKVFKGESLPQITPPSSSKPRPLVRNLTYTVYNHPESDDTTRTGALPSLPQPHSTEHITLRQLIMSDRSTSSGKSDSQHSLNDLLFPSNLIKKEKTDEAPSTSKPPPQVSFANEVIEHSLSTSHTLESTTSSEQTGPTQGSDSVTEESSSDSCRTDRLTGNRFKRLTVEQEQQLLNKDYVTFGELQQESIDEPDTSTERLRHFALDTIRKQMAMDRIRIESMTEQEDELFFDDYEFSEEDESGSTEDSSEEEEEEEEGEEEEDEDGDETETSKAKPQEEATSHIPVATSGALAEEAGSGGEKVAENEQERTDGVPDGAEGTEAQSQDIPQGEEGSGSAWQEAETRKSMEFHKSSDGIDGEKDDDAISLLPTRVNSAASGYRAMPPSRAESSRENSMDPEEMEKEKERLLQQWKESGGNVPAPDAASEHIILGGEVITINYSRPNTASDKAKDALIQNGIDLTQALPGEEKKLSAVWEEFNRDEREGGAMADYEFSTLLDEMIMDVNQYKPQHSTAGINSNSNSQSHSLQVSTQATSSWEQPKFDPSRKYTTLSELVSLLSHNLRLVSAETLEDHMASLISLISSVLRKVRKNKTEDDYVTQIACLSAIRVLCDRLQEMTSSQNLKYADLSWLFRVLCKYSSDSDSKIRPEASFCLARLVKVAGPTLVVRPIYFILVMESESGNGKSTTGAKTKAAAIDTLTYAMLTFPKEDFHNMEEIAGWVCLAMLNEERRIRQSALECLAIISQHLGGRDKALPLFHTLFLKEELDHFSRSPSPESHKTGKTGKSSRKGGSDPIPLSVHGTVRLLTGPGFPIAQPIDAITARLDKDVLPVPSTKGLIEYAVNVPTGKDLVLLMTHMLDKDDDEWDFSSSEDSLDSGSAHSKRSSVTSLGFSDIDWTGEGSDKNKKGDQSELISPDVAYILLGKGRVNKSDVVLLDTYKKEIIPEIIQMLNEKNKQGEGKRGKRRWLKNQKRKRKRNRKGKQRKKGDGDDDGPLIPTLSFDAEDDTLPPHDDDDDGETGEEVFDEPNSPVAVVVNPPPDDSSKS